LKVAGHALDDLAQLQVLEPGRGQRLDAMHRAKQIAGQAPGAVAVAPSGHLTERMQQHYSTVNAAEQRDALAKVIRLFDPKPTAASG
jgi:hypothetical protein